LLNGDRWSKFILLIVGAGLAYALNVIIEYITIAITHVHPTYIDAALDVNSLIQNPSGILMRTAEWIWQIYAGAPSMYGAPVWSASFVLLMGIAWVIRQQSISTLILFLGMLAAPFPLLLVSNVNMPLRALMGAPIALAFCALLAAQMAGWWRYAAVISLVLVGIQSAAAISQYQATRILTASYDRNLATQIYTRILDVTDSPRMILFYGGLWEHRSSFPVPFSSTASGSFFDWDGGNRGRMIKYMNIIGFNDLVLAPDAQTVALLPEIHQMKSWPAKGSVKELDGITIVKLGPSPGYDQPK
jgi:hypothetical protein